MAALVAKGHQVDYWVLALGHMGTMHLEIKTTAKELGGITQPKTLLLKLHAHAVNALHTIVQARRRLERLRAYAWSSSGRRDCLQSPPC